MSEHLLRLKACIADPLRREVRRDDGRVERLTPREADLLAYLARNPDRVVTRDELLEKVWGYAPTVVTRVVDTTVRRLREKVEQDPQQPDHVLTAFGEGYRFVAQAPDEAPPEPEDEPFVGRRQEVASLVATLSAAAAVVVLIGPPGAGKTRLARHLAWRRRLRSPVFVDVTEARDRPQVAALLARALGIEAGESGTIALRRAGEALRGRGACLAIFDNCEGVTAGVAEVIAVLRETAREARYLVTSRARVPVEGGVELPVGALGVDEAVELFAVLASRVRPAFAIDDETRPVLRRLVERLECIPLAIALAAGRAGALSPRAILDRLDDRFRLLASRVRDSDPRQRTLTAALDWSWDLLSPDEQRALAACSAFRGGFDAEAAGSVLDQHPAPDAAGVPTGDPGAGPASRSASAATGADRPDSDTLLAALCARSLLERRNDRYGGYAFVREYATARLAADPATEAEVFRRHGEIFAARYDRAARLERVERGALLSLDRANLVVATERAVAAGRAAIAERTGLGALDVIGREGPFEQGHELAHRILSLPDLSVRARTIVRLRLAVVELWTGLGDPWSSLDTALAEAIEADDASARSQVQRTRAMVLRTRGRAKEAVPLLEEALHYARASGSFDALANALTTLGVVLRELGRIDEARTVWVELLDESARRGELMQVAHACGNLAMIERRLGRVDRARELYEQALAHTVQAGDRRAEVVARVGLGNLDLDLGRLDEARAQYTVGLQLARDIGVRESEGRILGNLGLVERALGHVDLARAHLRAGLRVFEEMGEIRQAVLARGNLGELEVAAGDPAEGRALLDEVTRELEEMGDGPSEAEFLGPLVDAHLALGDLPAAADRVARGEALARASGNPLVVAQVLARRGLVELATGQDARATLVEAESLAQNAGEKSDTVRAVARLRERLGD